MSRYDSWMFFLQFALVLSLLLNLLLGAALAVIAWMYPNANKGWLPARLRTPPKLMGATSGEAGR